MFRSHNFNLKSISNQWSLRLGVFFQKIHYLYSSSMPHYLNNIPQIIKVALLLFISTLSSCPRNPLNLLFPPSCRCSPSPFPFSMHLVSTEQCMNWTCFPRSRSTVIAPIQFIKGQFSHTLPSMCFGCNEGYFSFVSHLCSTKNAIGLELIKMFLLQIP